MHRRPARFARPWRLATRLLALWLAAISVPGAQELIEDAVHVLADGHTAHDPEHAGEQPGHCCSGLFHSCACHTNSVATAASLLARLPPQRFARSHVSREGPTLECSGFGSDPFRPPIA
jgi:hypothetical protein